MRVWQPQHTTRPVDQDGSRCIEFARRRTRTRVDSIGRTQVCGEPGSKPPTGGAAEGWVFAPPDAGSKPDASAASRRVHRGFGSCGSPPSLARFLLVENKGGRR